MISPRLPAGILLDRLAVADKQGVTVVYDGHCVFCSAYVRLVRLRDAVGAVRLLDAREHDRAGMIAREFGISLNEGMLAIYGDRVYFGSDAIHVLSLLSAPNGLSNRVLARLFRSERTAAALYPVLRWGRNLTLRLLGREALPQPSSAR